MSQSVPTILIYNPISGHGHLDSWNALFVSLLLKAKWRVIAATPDKADLIARLEIKGQADAPNLQVLDWAVSPRTLSERVWGRVYRVFKPFLNPFSGFGQTTMIRGFSIPMISPSGYVCSEDSVAGHRPWYSTCIWTCTQRHAKVGSYLIQGGRYRGLGFDLYPPLTVAKAITICRRLQGCAFWMRESATTTVKPCLANTSPICLTSRRAKYPRPRPHS